MNNQARIIIGFLVVVIVGLIGYVLYQNRAGQERSLSKESATERRLGGENDLAQKTEPEDSVAEQEVGLVGADRDEHGCILSAGYSWCEAKQKCLRPWEEECETPEMVIGAILAEEHQRKLSEVKVTITKSVDDYVSGGVMFGAGGPGEGGMFLAMKQDGQWQVVFDGNGSVDCNQLRSVYHFPDEILRPNYCD